MVPTRALAFWFSFSPSSLTLIQTGLQRACENYPGGRKSARDGGDVTGADGGGAMRTAEGERAKAVQKLTS